jgi:hypothetical protein
MDLFLTEKTHSQLLVDHKNDSESTEGGSTFPCIQDNFHNVFHVCSHHIFYIPKGNTAEGDEKVGVLQGHKEWGVKVHVDEDVGVGVGVDVDENAEKNMAKPSYLVVPSQNLHRGLFAIYVLLLLVFSNHQLEIVQLHVPTHRSPSLLWDDDHPGI